MKEVDCSGMSTSDGNVSEQGESEVHYHRHTYPVMKMTSVHSSQIH